MNKENNIDNETPGTPDEEIANSIDAVLAKIDFEKISKDDVFHDLMHNSKLFSFRLMVASALLEQLHIRDLAKSGETTPDNVVRFNDEDQEPKS
jgi:hypothetical protein